MLFYKRFLLGLALTIVAAVLGFGFWHFNQGMFGNIIFFEESKKVRAIKKINNPIELKIKTKKGQEIKNIEDIKDVKRKQGIINILDVPFSSQAPFAEWDNPIYQDGCEEAASLMAVYWARNQHLLKTEANRKIIDMARWQEKNYGSYIDTNVDDTVNRIFKGYFGYKKVKIKKNIIIQDIINELAKGNVVIVPTNGRALGNPYYTPPGPERHNLVIRGYDKKTDEFITNDPGTKRGEGYRYKFNLLFNAIRDYPTGNHVEIEKVERNMIIVE